MPGAGAGRRRLRPGGCRIPRRRRAEAGGRRDPAGSTAEFRVRHFWGTAPRACVRPPTVGVHPHTIITGDLTELRDELEAGPLQLGVTGPPAGCRITQVIHA